ncbi:MAG: hypothetical protein KDD61_09595 [Bdellovibrionales bacterium]|nr:hypothetical protein [Bdellovibrionales bacterium]
MRIVKLWSIIILLTGLVSLTGCPGDDSPAVAVPPPTVLPNGGACPAGYYLSSNGTCLVDNTGTQWSQQLSWGNYLSITSKSQYRKFLQEYGAICDRNDGTMFEFLDFWQANCNTWDDRAYASIQLASTEIGADGVQGVVRFFAYNDWSNYAAAYIMLNPLDGSFLNIENNTGFELRRVGGYYYSYNGEIRIIVKGRPADSALEVKMEYRGVEFARATIYNQF